MSGFAAEHIFSSTNGFAYTYDDLILLPGRIDFCIDDVDLSTRLSRHIKLNIPLVSSPMDTVTEHDMAVSCALMG